MNSDIVLKVENVSKRYEIGVKKTSSGGLRHVLEEGLQNIIRWRPGKQKERIDSPRDFWALRDISFEVKEGDVLGIVGRNGAGKSTLLKILSRITQPTEGRVRIRGRVASLLEVGTGFHPELTGRENVFLNGTILGMTRKEISRKFDAIVAFSEIDQFIDTPVKKYSSGMYVRLAFAVAAHLDPEILVVDEVLAVGDAQFQKKCLGKMESVSKEGRTVLFVSHSMPTITALCHQALLLDQGRIKRIDAVSKVVLDYYGATQSGAATVLYTERNHRETEPIGDHYVCLVAASTIDDEGKSQVEIDIERGLGIEVDYEVLEKRSVDPVVNLHFFTADGVCAFISMPPPIKAPAPGKYRARCLIPKNFLNEGAYFVSVGIASFEKGTVVHAWQPHSLMFNIRDQNETTVTRSGYHGALPGAVRPQLNWELGGI